MGFIPTYCKDLGFDPNNTPANIFVFGSNWMNLIGICLLAMSFLIIILYLFSELLRDQKLKAWCKFELFQIIFSSLLLLFILGMLNWMCTFDVSSFYKWADPATANSKISDIFSSCGLKTQGKIITPYCVMIAYFDHLKEYGKILFWILFIANYIISQIVNFSVAAHPMGIGFTIEPAAGFRQITNLLTVAMNGYVLTFISLYVQEHLIKFFLIAMPYYFLPIGILVRAFVPTREFGGALIGFVIASIFFYPFTYVLSDIALGDTFNTIKILDIKNSLEQQSTDVNKQLENLPNDLLQQNNGDPNKLISIQPNLFVKALSVFSTIFSLLPLYFIGGGVIPLINFIIYIQAAATLSQMLGARLDISNITRMI